MEQNQHPSNPPSSLLSIHPQARTPRKPGSKETGKVAIS